MKFVSVQKIKLEGTYGPDILQVIEDTDFITFMREFKAPTSVILSDLWTLTQDQFQILSMWLCRGSKIHIAAKETKCIRMDKCWNTKEFNDIIPGAILLPKRTRTEWAYSFVDQLPQYYIDKGVRTSQEAYELGQNLIAKAQKASKIPFDLLEESYKRLMKACISSHVYATSPNAKTYFEANSEMSLDKDLADLSEISAGAELANQSLTDEQISFYARVFGIELPTYYLRTAYKATAHGYASMPYLTTNPRAGFSFDSEGRRMYAGNLDTDGGIKITPLTLQKDGLPKHINLDADRAHLAEQVMFFLNLPEDIRAEFCADGYSYCFDCHQFFQEIDGCSCGSCLPKAEAEQEIVKSAYLAYALSH
jgi:hypothetical protein